MVKRHRRLGNSVQTQRWKRGRLCRKRERENGGCDSSSVWRQDCAARAPCCRLRSTGKITPWCSACQGLTCWLKRHKIKNRLVSGAAYKHRLPGTLWVNLHPSALKHTMITCISFPLIRRQTWRGIQAHAVVFLDDQITPSSLQMSSGLQTFASLVSI